MLIHTELMRSRRQQLLALRLRSRDTWKQSFSHSHTLHTVPCSAPCQLQSSPCPAALKQNKTITDSLMSPSLDRSKEKSTQPVPLETDNSRVGQETREKLCHDILMKGDTQRSPQLHMNSLHGFQLWKSPSQPLVYILH